MYRIAFYIGLAKFKDKIEKANLDIGNPGLGGTQYLFLITVKYLNKRYGSEFAVLLTDEKIVVADYDIKIDYVLDESGAIEYCEENSVNTLVLNANVMDRLNSNVYNTNISIFMWAHNTLPLTHFCRHEELVIY